MRTTISGSSAAVLILVVLGGCTAVDLTLEARQRIRTVVVNPAVEQGEVISYSGASLRGYDPFPGVVYAVPVLRELAVIYALTPPGLWQVHRAYARMERALTERMRRAGIDVGDLVRRRLVRELERSRVFPVVLSDLPGPSGADARLDLAVDVGLGRAAGGFSAGNRPWLVVEAVLRDTEGRVLWRRSAEVSTFEERIEAREGQRFFDNPGLFRDSVSRAAYFASRELVEGLARPPHETPAAPP